MDGVAVAAWPGAEISFMDPQVGVNVVHGNKLDQAEDPAAAQVGNRSGMARLFLLRQPRATGGGDGEAIHLSIRDRMAALPDYRPVGNINGE